MAHYFLVPEQEYFLADLESRLRNREQPFKDLKIVSDLYDFWKFLQNCELYWIENKEFEIPNDTTSNYGLDLYVLNHEISITLTVLLKVKYGMPDSSIHVNFVDSRTVGGEVSLDPFLLEILEATLEET